MTSGKKRKRSRALENVGTKELLTALDIEAGIISEATLRVGQQLRRLQFEEKLLLQMLQRTDAPEDSTATPSTTQKPKKNSSPLKT